MVIDATFACITQNILRVLEEKFILQTMALLVSDLDQLNSVFEKHNTFSLSMNDITEIYL